MLANRVSAGRSTVSKIYKELLKLNNTKTNHSKNGQRT